MSDIYAPNIDDAINKTGAIDIKKSTFSGAINTTGVNYYIPGEPRLLEFANTIDDKNKRNQYIDAVRKATWLKTYFMPDAMTEEILTDPGAALLKYGVDVPITGKTSLKSILDNLYAGALMVKQGALGANAWINDVSKRVGNLTGSFDKGLNAAIDEQTKKLNDEVNKIDNEISTLLIDVTEHPFWIDYLKVVAQLAPYSAMFGGLSLIEGVTAGKATPFVISAVSNASSKVSALIMTGGAYNSLIKNNIDNNTAAIIAPVIGSINNLIERNFGVEQSLRGVFNKEMSKEIAGKLVSSGFLTQFAKKTLETSISESFEEAAQTLVDGLGGAIAELVTSNVPVDRTTALSVGKNIAESFLTTILTTPILSVPGNLFVSSVDVKRAKAIMDAAKTADNPEQVKAIIEPLINKEELENSNATVDDVAKAIYNKAQEDARKSVKERFDKILQGELIYNNQMRENRLDNGKLAIDYYVENVIDEDTVESIAKVVDPVTGNRYAQIRYTIQNGNVIINDADIKSGYEHLVTESLFSIAESSGVNVRSLIADDNADPYIRGAIVNIKKTAIPSSISMTLFRESLDNIGLDEYQKELASNLIFSMAKSSGKSVDDFLKPLKDITRSDKSSKELGYYGRIKTAEIVGEVKSVIELAQNSGGFELIHELTHFYRIHNKELFADIEKEYGVVNGKWNEEQEERFVNDFISMLSNKSVEKETVFSRIADFIKSIWQNITGIANNNVKQFFEQKILPYFDQNMVIPNNGFNEDISSYKVKPEDIAQKTNNSVKKERYLNNSWRSDPQLVAELKKENGIELNAGEKLILDTVKDLAEIENIDTDSVILYMSERQRKTLYPNDVWNIQQYNTFDELLNAVKGDNNRELKPSVIEFLKDRFDWVHNDSKQSIKLADFKKIISDDAVITKFINEAIKNPQMLSNHPFLYTYITKLKRIGGIITAKDINIVRKNISMNDAVGMYAFGNIMNDTAIMNSAIDILNNNRFFVENIIISKNKIESAFELNEAIMKIKNKEIRDKIISKTITLQEYEDLMNDVKAHADEYKMTAKEVAALAKINSDINKLKAYINKPVRRSVDIFYRDIINIMRKLLKSKSKEEFEEIIKTITDFKPLVYAMRKNLLMETLENVIDVASGKVNIKNMTLRQLQDIATIRKELEKEGRVISNQRKSIYNASIEMKREIILNNIPKEESKNILKSIDLITSPFNVIVERYLGNESYNLLVKDNIKTLTNWLDEYNKRVFSVEKFIQDNNLGLKLQRQITIKDAFGIIDKESVVYSASQLLGAYYLVGVDDEHTNMHQQLTFIYNNLMSKEEKLRLIPEIEESGMTAQEYLDKYVKEKVAIIRDAAQKNLSDKELELGRMIFEIMNTEENYLRLAEALYNLTGKELGSKEKFYFPLKMLEPVENISDNFINDLKGLGFDDIWKPGFIYERTKAVSPFKGGSIETDIFKVFTQSVWQQEFLINRGQYAKDILFIYRSNDIATKAIRERIENRLGEKGIEALDNYIREITRPNGYREKSMEDHLLGQLRTAYVVSTLAYRITVLVNQLFTSISPAIADAKFKHLSSVVFESIAKNPVKWYSEMEGKYGVLKNRQRTILDEIISDESKNNIIKVIRSFGLKGMDIVGSFPDRYITAICFESVRRTYLEKTGNEDEAITMASKHILETQPTSLTMFRSPLYQKMGGFKALVLLFTYPYNVMWQIVRHKIPLAFKKHQYSTALKGISAIAFTGLMQGLINIMRGRGPEDEDDNAKYIAHSIPESVIEYIPLVGMPLGNLYYSATVGGGSSGKFKDTYPILDDSVEIIGHLVKENPDKAIEKSLETVSRLLWLPVGAYKEYMNMFVNRE